jgi:hypothetical protein
MSYFFYITVIVLFFIIVMPVFVAPGAQVKMRGEACDAASKVPPQELIGCWVYVDGLGLGKVSEIENGLHWGSEGSFELRLIERRKE